MTVPTLFGLFLVALIAAPSPAQDELLLPERSLRPIKGTIAADRMVDVDLDGDGLDDLVVSGGTILMWRNLGRDALTPLPALTISGLALVTDLDGDGVRSVLSFVPGFIRQQTPIAPFVYGAQQTLASNSVMISWNGAADFDGDGWTDVVALPKQPNLPVLTWRNDGAAGLLAPLSSPASFMFGGNARADVGDLDGDGDLDIVTPQAFVLLGDGQGAFTQQPAPVVNTSSNAVALGSIDGDGVPDLVVVSNELTEILHGQGDASFTFMLSAETWEHGRICDLGNVDGDGDLEILTQAAGSGALAAYSVEGSGLIAKPGLFSIDDIPLACLADFDGDGRSGVVCMAVEDSTVIPLVMHVPGDGAGDFSVRETLLGGTSIKSVGVADIDGDTRAEVIYVQQEELGGLLLARDVAGDGSLGPPGPSTPCDDTSLFGGVADFDGDGLTDVLLEPNGHLAAMLSNGDGSFTPGGEIPKSNFVRFAAGDLEGDGDDDVLVMGKPPSWYASLGGGTFGAALPLGLAGTFTSSQPVTVGDLDGDGTDDVIVGRNVDTPDALEFFRGLGQASFAAPLQLGAGFRANAAVRLVDLDADGDLDLAASGGTGITNSAVTVVRSDGLGGFEPATTTPLSWEPSELLVAAELNGDGRKDLFVSGEVSYLWRSYLLQGVDGRFSAPRATLMGNVPVDIDLDRDDDMLDCDTPGMAGLFLSRTRQMPAFLEMHAASVGSTGAPVLRGSGPLYPGSTVRLLLRGAAPDAACQVVIGLESVLGPPSFRGPTQITISGLSTDAEGRLYVTGEWPADLPSGFALYAQFWSTDSGQPGGVCGSNVVQLAGS